MSAKEIPEYVGRILTLLEKVSEVQEHQRLVLEMHSHRLKHLEDNVDAIRKELRKK